MALTSQKHYIVPIPNHSSHGAHDIPQSSMVALLINKVTTANRPSPQAEPDELQRLTTEVSDFENNATKIDDPSIHLKHKHKLIYVLSLAVLERFKKDDNPFVNYEELVDQASESLDLFCMNIDASPMVLSYVLAPGESFMGRGTEPLWIWLFPKILSLLGRRRCECLSKKITNLFHVSFKAVFRVPRLWHLSSQFFRYLMQCASTTLTCLEKANMTHLNVLLPSNEVEFLSSLDDTACHEYINRRHTYTIKSVTHGLNHLCNLLLLVSEISTEASQSYHVTLAFQDYSIWLLDSIVEIHKFLSERHILIPAFTETYISLNFLLFLATQSFILKEQGVNLQIIARKGINVLSSICVAILETSKELSTEIQSLFSETFFHLASICKEDASVRRKISIHLIPVLGHVLSMSNVNTAISQDFQVRNSEPIACFTANTQENSCHRLSRACAILQHNDREIDSSTLTNTELRNALESSKLPPQDIREETGYLDASRPRKKRKIDELEPLAELTSTLYDLINKEKVENLKGLNTFTEECFNSLSDEDRCNFIECLGRIVCGTSGHLTMTCKNKLVTNFYCLVCEGEKIPKNTARDESDLNGIKNEVIQVLTSIIKFPAFMKSRRARVVAMMVIKKVVLHCDDQKFYDLETSMIAQWCLQSLTSSVRELRVAASRTAATFLRGSSDNIVIRSNRSHVFEILRRFPDEQGTHLQETCIFTWGQIGRIVKDDELNIVLLALVQYLGHSNPVVSGAAFNEILRLTRALDTTVSRLFSPFWGTVANEAVKDLLVKPTTTQLMADLLQITVVEFLLLTQSHTIPWLVMGKRTDVIKRISVARKDAEVGMACAEASNLVPTLALLMIQDVPDIENYIMSHLKYASPRFKDTNLDELMRVEPASQALHLLKAAGEAQDDKKRRIYAALRFLAERAPIPNSKKKKSNPIGAFLEQHILGLITTISAVIIDIAHQQSVTEKRRHINALEELVKVAKSYSRIGRPQICACLQSALSQNELQAPAFLAWTTMLTSLDDDDVEAMLESTFSTIIQYWESFDDATQSRAENVLQYLLQNRARIIHNMIKKLPSLSNCIRLSEIEGQLEKIRKPTNIGNSFEIFSHRIGHENSGVVTQALMELRTHLHLHQSYLQASAVSEQPEAIVGVLIRSILDTCIKFNDSNCNIATLSAECIGLIGCLDSNRVESIREHHEMVVVSNFEDGEETLDFVLFLLQEVIVPAFLSATDTVLQGFLSYVMQELLEICQFKEICAPIIQGGSKNSSHHIYLKWTTLPVAVQDTLTPFLTSKYSLKSMEVSSFTYPIFRPEKIQKIQPNKQNSVYIPWLRNFALNLLGTPLTKAAKHIFPPLCRAIRIKDISIANFLLPYLILHVIVAGGTQQRYDIGSELLTVLTYKPPPDSNICGEDLKLCIEIVFRVFDYLARWIQEKRSKRFRHSDTDESVERIQSVMKMISPDIISARAVECKSYSRALFYWEQHIRDIRENDKRPETRTTLLHRLQDIYNQIDEPDGIEGISAYLHVLDIDQQILGHRRSGRWTTAQSWYEIKFAEQPENVDIQLNLLTCLKESGQHDVLLNYLQGMNVPDETISKFLPLATESSWVTGRWSNLERYVFMPIQSMTEDFNVSVGRLLLVLQKNEQDQFSSDIKKIREKIARSLSTATTSSLNACHDTMLKLHVLTDLEIIAGTDTGTQKDLNICNVLGSLDRRLEVLGAYLNDKQYLLGIRRAAMQLSSSLNFSKGDIAASWLTSARLARKGNAIHQSFNAVLRASQLGDESATIEHARLLWREGQYRKAIQSLRGAIESNAFISHDNNGSVTNPDVVNASEQQNLLTARAHLLLAKWLDSAGQTQSSALRTQYQLAAKTHTSWEKGHYYLGRHYNKLLETEKNLAPEIQNEHYLIGEMAKLVIENYLRSLSYGTKYIYQTLPRILTLWLELGSQVIQPLDTKYGNSKEFMTRVATLQKKNLQQIHSRIQKYSAKLPAYIFYTALPQIVARIAHPNQEVFNYLAKIIYRVVEAHPQQAMWILLAVCQSKQQDRKARGMTVLQYIRANKNTAPDKIDMKLLIKNGEKLTNDLLQACEAGDFHGSRTIWCSLARDLGFNQKNCLPSLMAVPVESVLTATLPTLTDNMKSHNAFSRDTVIISSFADEVMVLSSLQKPRKLTARGSDGRKYGLMCKPKDDLRKDQRLMEFNAMINRSLKRDAESSRRQLYIKTYAVTPLNEECGIIEWVDGLKTSRDILLQIYKARGITPNYKEIESLCDKACKSESQISFFTDKVLGTFPPVLYQWFVSQFPEPSAWFAARLRYTRSCAVMSMVGTILGLGDRHGENVLLEEGNGGIFHVDFNCLFEKGLTFAKPERVPFRLTHNMVDAMGMYGYEGPFRKSSELTLKLLRQHEETLMTILEAFVYDPTLDLLSRKTEKKKKQHSFAVPDTAKGVLNSIQRKVRGLLPGESVPLGVEGQVDELIKQATNPIFLAGMYIGWCSFL
ncbi:Protein kinase [Podosphaera aphanis]|nr:Protein kinase [Podosphaera aphanis]